MIIIKFSLGCALLLSQIEKKCNVAEINNNVEKNAKSKKYSKTLKKPYRSLQRDNSYTCYFNNHIYFPDESSPNQLKTKKLKEENPKNKLQKRVESNKSPRINNVENTKCQCKSKRNIQNIVIY